MSAATREHPALNRRFRLGWLAACMAGGLLMSDLAVAQARTYEIDQEHFAIMFKVDHIGYADVIGLFLKAKGSFVYDEATRTLVSGRVEVDPASVFSNHERRDDHVRNKDFLNVRSHPNVVFEAVSLDLDEQGEGRLEGKLTLLGKTLPVTLDVSLNRAAAYPFGHKQHTLGISASTVLRRSDWGMTYGVAGNLVGDEVSMQFEFEAIQR